MCREFSFSSRDAFSSVLLSTAASLFFPTSAEFASFPAFLPTFLAETLFVQAGLFGAFLTGLAGFSSLAYGVARAFSGGF